MSYWKYLKLLDLNEEKLKKEEALPVSSNLGDVGEYIEQIRNYLIKGITPPFEKFSVFKETNNYLFEKFRILASSNYEFLKTLEAENSSLLQLFLKDTKKKKLDEVSPQEIENNPKVQDLKALYLYQHIGDPEIAKMFYSYLLDYYLDNKFDIRKGEILSQNFKDIKNLLNYASTKLPEIKKQVETLSPEGIKIDFKQLDFSEVDDLYWATDELLDTLAPYIPEEKKKKLKELVKFLDEKATELSLNHEDFFTSDKRIDKNRVLEELQELIDRSEKEVFPGLADYFLPQIKTQLSKRIAQPPQKTFLEKLTPLTPSEEAWRSLSKIQLSPEKEEVLKYINEKKISLLSENKIKELTESFPIITGIPKEELRNNLNRLALSILPDIEFFNVFGEIVSQVEETKAYLNSTEQIAFETAVWHSLPENLKIGYQLWRFTGSLVEPIVSNFYKTKYADVEKIFYVNSQKTLYETVKKIKEQKGIDATDILLLDAFGEYKKAVQTAPFLINEEKSLATMAKWIIEYMPITAIKAGLITLGAPGVIATVLSTVAGAELRSQLVKNLNDKAYEIALEPIQIDTQEGGIIIKGALRDLKTSQLIARLDEYTEIGTEQAGELFLDTFFKALFSGISSKLPFLKLLTDTPILKRLFVFQPLNSWASEIGEELLAMPLEKLWRGEKITGKDFINTAWEALKTFTIFYGYTNLPASLVLNKGLTNKEVENILTYMKESSKAVDYIKEIDGELYVFDDFTKEGENTYKVTLVNVNDKNKTHIEIITKEQAEDFFSGFNQHLNSEKAINLVGDDIEIVRTLLNYGDWKKFSEKFGQKIDKPERIDEMDLVMLQIPEDFKNNPVFKPIAQIFEKEGFKEFSLLVFHKIGQGKQVEFISFPLDNNKILRISPKILKDLQGYVQILNFKDNFPEANDIINIANLTKFGESLDIYYINSKGEQAKISIPREDFSKIKKDNRKGIDIFRIGSKTIPLDNIYGAILRGIEKNIGFLNPEFLLTKRGVELVRTREVKPPYTIYGINWSKALPYLVSDELKIYILNIPLFPSQRQALKILAILKRLNDIKKEINEINESLKTVSEKEKADLSLKLENLQKEQERLNNEFNKIAKKFTGELKKDFIIHYAFLRKDGDISIREDNFPDFFKNVEKYIKDNYKMSLEEFLGKHDAQLLVKFKDTGSIVISKKDEKGRKKVKKIAEDIVDVSENDLKDAEVSVYDFRIGKEINDKLNERGYEDPDVISFFVRNYGENGLKRIIKLDLKYEDYIALLKNGYNISDIKRYIFKPSLSLEKAKNNLSQMLKFKKEDFLSGETKIEKATEEEPKEEMKGVEKGEEEKKVEEIRKAEEEGEPKEEIEKAEEEEDRIELIEDNLKLLLDLGWNRELLIRYVKNKEIIEDIIKNKKSFFDVFKEVVTKYGFRPEDLNDMDLEEKYRKINGLYNPQETVFYPYPRFIKIILQKEFSHIFSHHLSIFLNPFVLFWQKWRLDTLNHIDFIDDLEDTSLSVLFSKLQQDGIINFEKFSKEVTPDVIHRYISGVENNRKELKDFLKQSKEFQEYFTKYLSLLTEFFDKIDKLIREFPSEKYFDEFSRFLIWIIKKYLIITKLEVEIEDKKTGRKIKDFFPVPLFKLFDEESIKLAEKGLGMKIEPFEVKPFEFLEYKGKRGVLKIDGAYVKLNEEKKEVEYYKEIRPEKYEKAFQEVIKILKRYFEIGYVVNREQEKDFFEFFKKRKIENYYIIELNEPVLFAWDLLYNDKSIDYQKSLKEIISLHIYPSFENILTYLRKFIGFGYYEHEKVSNFYAELERFFEDFFSQKEINVKNLKRYAIEMYILMANLNDALKKNTFYYFIEIIDNKLSSNDLASFLYNYIPFYFVYYSLIPTYLNFENLQYPFSPHFRLSTSSDYKIFLSVLKNMLENSGLYDKSFYLFFGKILKGKEKLNNFVILNYVFNNIRRMLFRLKNDVIKGRIKGKEINNLKFLGNLGEKEINDLALKEAKIFLENLKAELKEEALPKKPQTIFKVSSQNIGKVLQLLKTLYKNKDLTNKALYFYLRIEKERKTVELYWRVEKISDDKIIFHYPIFWDTELQRQDALQILQKYGISLDTSIGNALKKIEEILQEQYKEFIKTQEVVKPTLTEKIKKTPEFLTKIDSRLEELKFKLKEIIEQKIALEETPISHILGKEVSFKEFEDFLVENKIKEIEFSLPDIWINKTKEGFIIYPYDIVKTIFDPYGLSASDIGVFLDIPSILDYLLRRKENKYIKSLLNFIEKFNQWLKKQPHLPEIIFQTFGLHSPEKEEFWNLFEGNTKIYITKNQGQITVNDFTYYYKSIKEKQRTIFYDENEILVPILVFEDAEGNLLIEDLKIRFDEDEGDYVCDQKLELRDFLRIITSHIDKIPSYIFTLKEQLGSKIKKLKRFILLYNPESGTILVFRSGEKELYYDDIKFEVQNKKGELYSYHGIPKIDMIKNIEYSGYLRILLSPIQDLEKNFWKISLSNYGEKKYGKIRFIYNLNWKENLPLKELDNYNVTYFNDPNLYLINEPQEKFTKFLETYQKKIVNENFDVINKELDIAFVKIPVFLLRETERGYEAQSQEISLKKFLEDFSPIERTIELNDNDISLILNSLASYKDGINKLYSSSDFLELFYNILQFNEIFQKKFLEALEINEIPTDKELEIKSIANLLDFLENFLPRMPSEILETIKRLRELYEKLEKAKKLPETKEKLNQRIKELNRQFKEAEKNEEKEKLIKEIKKAEKELIELEKLEKELSEKEKLIDKLKELEKLGESRVIIMKKAKIVRKIEELEKFGVEARLAGEIEENSKYLFRLFRNFLERKKLQQLFLDKIYEYFKNAINKFPQLPSIDDLSKFYEKYYIIPKEQFEQFQSKVLSKLNDAEKAIIYYLHPFILTLKDLDLSKIEDPIVRNVLSGIINLINDKRALVLILLTGGRFHFDLFQAFLYFYMKSTHELLETKNVVFLPNILTAYLPYFFAPDVKDVDNLWRDLYFYYLFGEQPSVFVSGGKFALYEPRQIMIEGDIFDILKQKYELFRANSPIKNLKEFIKYYFFDTSREVLAIFVIKNNEIKEMRLLGIGNEDSVIPSENYKEIYEDLKEKYPKEEGYMLLEVHNHPANTLPTIHNFNYYFRIRRELGFDAEYYKSAVLTEDYIFFIDVTPEEYSKNKDFYEKNFQGYKLSKILEKFEEKEIPFLKIYPLEDFTSKYIIHFYDDYVINKENFWNEIRQRFSNVENPDVVVFPDTYVSLFGYEIPKLENAETLKEFFKKLMINNSYRPFMYFMVFIKDKFPQEWVSTAFEEAIKEVEKDLKTKIVGECIIYGFDTDRKQITKLGYARVLPVNIFPLRVTKADLEQLENFPYLKEEISEEKEKNKRIELFINELNDAIETGKDVEAIIDGWIERGITDDINTYIEAVAERKKMEAKLFDMPQDFREYILDFIQRTAGEKITITNLINERIEPKEFAIRPPTTEKGEEIKGEEAVGEADITGKRIEMEEIMIEEKKIKIPKIYITILQNNFYIPKEQAIEELKKMKGDPIKTFINLARITQYPTKEDIKRNPNILLNSEYILIHEMYVDENEKIIKFNTENDAKARARILNEELPDEERWQVGRARDKYFLYRDKIILTDRIEELSVKDENLIIKATGEEYSFPLDNFIHEENQQVFNFSLVLQELTEDSIKRTLRYLPNYYIAQKTDNYEDAEKAKEELYKRGFSEKDLKIEEYKLKEGGSVFIIWARRRHFEIAILKGYGKIFFEAVQKIRTTPYFPAMFKLAQLYVRLPTYQRQLLMKLMVLAMLYNLNLTRSIEEVNNLIKELKLLEIIKKIKKDRLLKDFFKKLSNKIAKKIRPGQEIATDFITNKANEILDAYPQEEKEQLTKMLETLYLIKWLIESWEKIRTTEEFQKLQGTPEGQAEIAQQGLMSIDNLPNIISPYTNKEIRIYDYIDKNILTEFHSKMSEFYDKQRREIVRAILIASGFEEVDKDHFWREGSFYHLDDMVKTWGKDYYFPHTFFGQYLLKINDKIVASYNDTSELAYILTTETVKHYLGEKRNKIDIEHNLMYSGNASSILLLNLSPGMTLINYAIRTRNYSMLLFDFFKTLFSNLGMKIEEISKEEKKEYEEKDWQVVYETEDKVIVAKDETEKTDVRIIRGISNLMRRETETVDVFMPLVLEEVIANNAFQTKRWIQRLIFRSSWNSVIRGVNNQELLSELLKIENDLFGVIRDPIAERLNAIFEGVVAFFQRLISKSALVKPPIINQLAETILSWSALLASAVVLVPNIGYHLVNSLQVPVLGTIHYGPVLTMKALWKTLKYFRPLGRDVIGNLWKITLSSMPATAGQADIERRADWSYKIINPTRRFISSLISVAELLNQRWGFMIGIEMFNELLNSKIKMIVNGKIQDVTFKEYLNFLWTKEWKYSEKEIKNYLEMLAILTGIFVNYQINFSRVMRGFYPRAFDMPFFRTTVLWLKGYFYGFIVNFIARLQNPSLNMWNILINLGQDLLSQKPDKTLLQEAVKFLDKYPNLNENLLKLLDLVNFINEKGIEIPNEMTLEEILKQPEVKDVKVIFDKRFFSITRKLKWERLRFLAWFIIIYFLLLGLRGIEWLMSLFYRLVPELDQKVSIAKQSIKSKIGENWYYFLNYGVLSTMLGYDWVQKFLPAISIANFGRTLAGSAEVMVGAFREWRRVSELYPFKSKLTTLFIASLRQSGIFWPITQITPSIAGLKNDIVFTQELNPLGRLINIREYTPKFSLAYFLSKYLSPSLLYILGIPLGHSEMVQTYRFLENVTNYFNERASYIRSKVLPVYILTFDEYLLGKVKKEEYERVKKTTKEQLKLYLKSIEKGYEMLGITGEEKREKTLNHFITSLSGYAFLASSNLIQPNLVSRQIGRANDMIFYNILSSPTIQNNRIIKDALKEYLLFNISDDIGITPNTTEQLLILLPLIKEVLEEEPTLKKLLEAEKLEFEPKEIKIGKLYELFKKSKK